MCIFIAAVGLDLFYPQPLLAVYVQLFAFQVNFTVSISYSDLKAYPPSLMIFDEKTNPHDVRLCIWNGTLRDSRAHAVL